MRILYLSTGIFNSRYGQQTFEWNFLSSCLIKQPYRYFRIILLNDRAESLPENFINPYAKFVFCGNSFRMFSKIKFAFFSFWYALIERPKIILCAHINVSFICLIISRVFKLKYMILTHGIEVWNIRKKFKLIALSKARIIVSVSRYTIYRIREQLSGVAGRNYLLPNTVDTERFKPDKKLNSLVEQYNLSGYRVILTVARLDYNDRDKGYDKVIYALAKVIAEIPNVKYLLVGKGDDIRRIHRLVDSLGLNAYVILTGFISNDELPSYYNLCDLFIMPSLQEGFGIVFLEALACGKPVIGGNRDGTRDAFLDGRLGVLIDPDDTNQISDAIVRILRREVNSDLLDANFLRGAVIENFGLEHFKRQVFELLDYVS